MSIARRMLVVAVVIGFPGTLALLQVGARAGQQPAPPPPAQAAPRPPVIIAQKRGPRRVPIQALPAAPAPAPDSDPDGDTAFTEGLTLPSDRKADRSLSLAEDLIKEGDWSGASEALQSLLERQEDVLIKTRVAGRGGKQEVIRTSARTAADRLIGTMPADGLQVYELKFGHKARSLLNEAKAQGDPQRLAEVAQKYLHTEAGVEAANLLGTYYLDRGGYVMAARCFERLLHHPAADKLSALTLFKAALACRRAGDTANAEEAWKRLARLNRDGLRVGDRTLPLDQLQQELDRASGGSSTGQHEWPVVRGNASRSAQGDGGAPYLDDVKYRWETTQYDPSRTTPTRQWVENAANPQQHQAVLPAATPIAVTARTEQGPVPLVVYRSYGGVHAVDLRTGELFWKSPSYGGLDTLLADPQKLIFLNQWLQIYNSGGSQTQGLLYENSVTGTLSSDGTRVYLVDDLALPPHPSYLQNVAWGSVPNFGALKDFVRHNSLQAFAVDTGKLVWELGGKDEKSEVLTDSYFLGPPLPLGGKLYVLNQKQSELRLLCLDPPHKENDPPAIAWTQTLANTTNSLLQDVSRRTQAAHLAYGEGILVCPTNAGAVVGVDLLSHSLLWAHAYRQPPPSNPELDRLRLRGVVMVNTQQTLIPDWKDSSPVVAEGKVVFTAPDGTLIHCLNLRDGQPVWTANRADDLYLAGVFGGKVLLVGKSACRALSLADGKQLWQLDTGTPSGQGVASKGVYYLPLRSGSQTKEPGPEVCAIDVEKGLIQGHSRVRKKPDAPAEVPGNLVFFGGDVISQTATAVSVYPQLDVKLAQIDERLKKDPRDPVGLTERGEMRLDKGDLRGAVDDLRTALANHPPEATRPKTRTKLYEALTELFQRDFASSEPYLEEYRELCQVDVPADADANRRKDLEADQQRRRARFLCLLAKGREGQGRLLDAFRAYEELGTLAGGPKLLPVVDQPALQARPDVLARGRIAALMAEADAEKRRPLEEEIARRWSALRETSDLEALKAFVAVFGSLCAEGTEARLLLADRLAEAGKPLEAELQLLPLRRSSDEATAARAVEGLARLMTRQGLMEDAAYYYRLLGSRFAGVSVRDGKKGADYLKDLATDKRFLPYLDDPSQTWTKGPLKGREVSGAFQQMRPVFHFEPEGEVLPFFQRHELVLVTNTTELKFADRGTGEELLSLPLNRPQGPPLQPYYFSSYPGVRFPFHMKGHLVVVNVGAMVYGLDPVGRRVLWERSLVEGGPNQANNYVPDREGGLQALYPDNFVVRLGRTGPVGAGYVCLQTRQGLQVLDPLTGDPLWSRGDVTPQTQLFGDDQHLFAVELRDGNPVGVGRALRADDGVAVDVPDFAPLYPKRLASPGGQLLLSEAGPAGQVVLRFYDVQGGRDVWRKEFPAKSRVLHTEELDLAGVIDPTGKVTVFDLQTRKEVLEAEVDAKEVERVPEDGQHAIHLLADAGWFYLVLQGPPDPVANPFGGPWTNLTPGLHTLTINGKLYAFARHAGNGPNAFWQADVPNQMIVLDRFADLPVILFTARYNKPQDPKAVNRGAVQVAATRAIDKRTGKLVWDREVPNGNQFYALNVDEHAGVIALVSWNQKIEFYQDSSSAKK